jgi:dehydrogenase/reductase SDR family protein 7
MLKLVLSMAVLAVTVVFFIMDADFLLYLSPQEPSNAYAEKVVWIVGASSGIGAGLALDFAKSGAKVILSARRVEKLHDLSKAILAEYPTAPTPQILPFDILQSDSYNDTLQAIVNENGKLDVLVLNPGIAQAQPAMETPEQGTRDIMELNFFSYVKLAKAVLPSFVKQKSGKILVISSVSGIIGTALGSSYSASKFALHGYFGALRSEVDKLHGISVHIACPGPVESEIHLNLVKDPNVELPPEGERMPTRRCSELIVKGVYHNLSDMWVVSQPFLIFAYMAQYAPGLFRQLSVQLAGPARVKALASGGDTFDVLIMLGLKSPEPATKTKAEL